MASGIRWTGDLEARLNTIRPVVLAGIAASGQKIASDGESWMKSNAPWTDQTGAARNGLVGNFEASARGGRVVFAHSVPYGIWLEVRWSGRYAIVLPAVEEFSRRWGRLLAAMIFAGAGR